MHSGGDLLVESLVKRGVKYIFTLSGLQTQAIYDSCIDHGITLIDTRHEQTAVFMADAWARATGNPGVALLSAGPGMTNGITPIANAHAASSPCVVIAGRSSTSEAGKGAFQELDQISLVAPITRCAATVQHTSDISVCLDKAFDEAAGANPGPVFIDIPTDVLTGNTATNNPAPAHDANAGSDADVNQIERAFDLIANAKRPIILAGTGVHWANVQNSLRSFVETMQIPVIVAGMAKGVVPDDHPLCLGPVHEPLSNADVILILGADLDYSLSYGQPPLFNKNASLIQIDSRPGQIGKNKPVQVGICASISDVIAKLDDLAKDTTLVDRTDWIGKCAGYKNALKDRIASRQDTDPIHSLRLCQEINDFLDRDATVVVDGGDTSVFGKAAINTYLPGHWLDVGPLWCIGVGVPFGLAAKLARPEKQTLILSGDGSFGYGVFEYNTAIRHDIPIVSVVNNDGAWGMIRHDQVDKYGSGRVTGTELGVTPYHKIVEAMGGLGLYVDQADQIRPALVRAFASGVPACINVRVDPNSSSAGLLAKP
ncbi:MAG: thiamine pyrophosphate-binding protein [Chloroflexi bacterium]|jgi:acetolactate synthase I/II/III large subunit|nr:thiamine pyrophosphate-binding protein [Chloroflexota bacterium]MBT7082355.1 thiamine pyrophosphate-binding protein [Chloroflexota bacterium]MBT7289097.1 thiamine pyrophosphate-binding protein [Chloroflexota bacterium]